MSSVKQEEAGRRGRVTRVAIRALALDERDRLQPVWLALHEHHIGIAPRLAGMPARVAQEAWNRRRAIYAEWAKDPETFVLVAEAEHQLVGYAFVTINRGYSSWDSGERQAQLQTLSVAPEMRSQGVGEQLLAAVRERLAAAGIESIALGAAHPNERAHRFYERHGFRPAEIVFVGTTEVRRDDSARRLQ
jgi:GNAT superfamily N-acetyltransferase